jgi:hypothetical protein
MGHGSFEFGGWEKVSVALAIVIDDVLDQVHRLPFAVSGVARVPYRSSLCPRCEPGAEVGRCGFVRHCSSLLISSVA